MSAPDELPAELPEGLATWVVAAVERELAGDEPSPLALHAEGALPPDEAARVEALAAKEPAVAARLAALRAALPAQVRLPDVPLPDGLRAFALEAVRTHAAPPRRRAPLLVPLALLALGLALGALVTTRLGPGAATPAAPAPAAPAPAAPPPAPERERFERLEASAASLRAALDQARADQAAAQTELAAAKTELAAARSQRDDALVARDDLAVEAARLGAALDEAQALARRRAAEELARPAPELTDRTVVRVRGVERWDAVGRLWTPLAAGQQLEVGSILRGAARRNDLELAAGATLLGQGLYVVSPAAIRPVPILDLGREPVVGPPAPERRAGVGGWQRLARLLGGGR